MNMAWICTLVLILALGGCAGLRQFPEKSAGPDAVVLADLDSDYAEALNKIYGETTATTSSSNTAPVKAPASAPAVPATVPDLSTQPSDADKVDIRNLFIERRLAVIDANFLNFVRDLARGNANADLLVALAEIGSGAAGALVSESASQILSAVSGSLAGGKAAYDKAVLYDNALTALIAQMAAKRQQVAVKIFTKWRTDIETYPLWLARQDIGDYELAGSLPGAIIATAEDAKKKADDAAEDILKISLPAITKASVSKEMFELRAQLLTEIDGLSGEKAKALVPKIMESIKSAEPDLALYTNAIRANDPDGSRARNLLREAVTAARTREEVVTWQGLIAGL